MATLLLCLAPALPASVVAFSTGHPIQRSPSTADWREHLQVWLNAVASHHPGSADAPAQLVGNWSEVEIDLARRDFLELVGLNLKGTLRGLLPDTTVSYRGVDFRLAEIRTLLDLSDGADAFREGVNRILRRGAVLHADIAMLVTPFASGSVGCRSGPALFVDGREVGSGCSNYHWEKGRLLLDALKPGPAKDPIARLWYHATIAYLLEVTNYTDAEPHIDYARTVFPTEAVILFEHGCFHESMASARAQAVIRESRPQLGGSTKHLTEAEWLFRDAVRADPAYVEARVHHGFVLDELERYEAAATELRPALEAAQGRLLQYYGEMFLGRAEEGLGHYDASRARYAKAAGLYPYAQSPWMAISHLERRVGDRAKSVDAMHTMFGFPSEGSSRFDPWWSYHLLQDASSAKLLAELYRTVDGGGRP